LISAFSKLLHRLLATFAVDSPGWLGLERRRVDPRHLRSAPAAMSARKSFGKLGSSAFAISAESVW